MLRLSAGPASGAAIARDLKVAAPAVEDRLRRLRSLGTVRTTAECDEYALLPEAHQIILRISEPGLGHDGIPGTERSSAGCARRLERLQVDPMFRILPREELDWLTRVSRDTELTPGEVLLLEGDECHGLYIVDSGTVRLSKASSSPSFGFGREQTIRLMIPGDSFNEVPVFDGGVNPVTAEALDEARVIMVPKKEVQALVNRSPEFSRSMMLLMSQRFRHLVAMIEDMSMRDVTGRVAKILLQVQQPSDGVGAGLSRGRRLTQREIADMAGTAREVVARVLKKLEHIGAVRVSRGKVTILDPELLSSLT